MGILLLIVLGIVLDLAFMSALVLISTNFLHSQWWEAVPLFNAGEALIVGALIIAFSYVVSEIGRNADLITLITKSAIGVIVMPFVLPVLIGMANDSLFPAMPDIGYFTVLTLSFIGLGIGVFKYAVFTAFEKIVEAA